MTNDQIKAMILDLLCKADYDLYKSYLFPEEPEYAEENMNDLIDIAKKHIK